MILWRLALAFLPELQQLAKAIGAAAFGLVLLTMPMLAVHAQPWSPWWFTSGEAIVTTLPPNVPGSSAPITGPGPNLGSSAVTDSQRYQLARAAGFSAELAILLTAISIAENGSGNPALMSPVNRNGTRDLGLWQINTIWWAQFGGPDALTDPWRNAQAAFYIYGRQGPCAWSTYEVSCGPGHVGTYRAFMERARQASLVQPPANQA